MSIQQLRSDIIQYTLERTEAIARRFLPDFEVPGYLAGYRTAAFDTVDLLYLLLHLNKVGIHEVCGVQTREIMPRLLRKINGAKTETFYSYRTAEVILHLGGFQALEGFSEADLENLRQAVDTTHIFKPDTRTITVGARNYWFVLARAEYLRQKLGVLPDATILNTCIAQTREMLSENPTGFFDDSSEGQGRYDSYSADIYLFLEPLREFFDAELIRRNLRSHVKMLEAIALENGASVAWGRSIGALSLCLTMELAALGLHEDLATDRNRAVALIRNAFEHFKGWFQDDLISAHRGRMTESYRGVHRLLQMSLDSLCKLGKTAEILSGCNEPDSAPVELFPSTDTLIRFEENRNAGLWMFRNQQISFQLPIVGGANADYAGWFHSPGLFDNPVESAFVCGVPHFANAEGEFICAGLPSILEKRPNGITLRFEQFHRCHSRPPVFENRGIREVSFSVIDDTVTATETWSFTEIPQAVGFQIPESKRPLYLEVESNSPFRRSTVAVEGMAEWRGAWHSLTRLHQIDFTPAEKIEFRWKIRPALKVTVVPASHDYLSALYSAMPDGAVSVRRLESGSASNQMTVEHLAGDSDIFHVGWPEHLFNPGGMKLEDFDQRYFQLVEALGQAPVKVIWTMHNRRPHAEHWRGSRSDQLYRAWASVADAVIHHSRCGMEMMRNELPYKKEAIHVVIPHGHYGAQMAVSKTRAELEQMLQIPPAKMRLGVLGRAQKEKQVEMIARAFMKAARPDQQLLITAHPIDLDVSGDPRIILLPRPPWFTRELIAAQVHVCDALVSAHAGETYLTSGTIADAIGAGIPMITNEWEFFREMLGDSAIYHDNTEESLTEVFRRITPEEIARGKTATTSLQPRFDWHTVADQTLTALRQLGTIH